MTYINEINRFWRLSNSLTLSTNAKILYLYLLHESNAVGLKSSFCLPISAIINGTGLTVKQYRRARDILMQHGMVGFQINQATHVANVKMCLFGQPIGFPRGQADGKPNGNPNGYPNGHPNGYPKNFLPLYNTYRREERREEHETKRTYDPEAFFAAAVARGERRE